MKGNDNTTMKSIVSAMILWCLVFSGALSAMVINVGSSSVPEPTPLVVIPAVIDDITFSVIDQGVIDVDHSIDINSGGELIVINSVLNFLQDMNGNDYYLNVNGGNLTLEGSTITTGATPQVSWYPWFEMNFNNANFTMTDYSTLAFPGWLNITDTRTYFNDTWITSLWPNARTNLEWSDMFPSYMNAVDVAWWLSSPLALDDTNDDGPVIVFLDCDNVTISDSRIDEVLEDDNLMPLETFTETFLPNSIDTTHDTTGEDISRLWYPDGFYYTLVSWPNMLWVDGFDTLGYSDGSYNVVSAELYVEYNNLGYNYTVSAGGINSFNYSHPSINSGDNVTAFQVAMNQPTNVNNVTDIYTNIDTLSLMSELNVTFLNYDDDALPKPPDSDEFHIDVIQLNVTLEPLYNYYPTMISLNNSEVTVINSYVSIDWLDFSDTDGFPIKNAFDLLNGSNLYLYGVTMDETGWDQVDQMNPDSWMPYRVETGSETYNCKWLDVSVVDRYNAAVVGADVNAVPPANATHYNQTVKFNQLDTGTNPSDKYSAELRILDYLGKTNVTYNVTDADGRVLLPLLSEYINGTNYFNGDHVGEYDVNIYYTYDSTNYTGYTSCDFIPFPETQPEENLIEATSQINELRLPRDVFSPGLVVNDGNSPVSLNFNEQNAEYCYILVEDNAQLIIYNADLTMGMIESENFEIRVRSGGTLTFNNVDIVTEGGSMPFIVEENAKVNMIDSSTSNYINFQASGNANVTLIDSRVNGNFDVTDSTANVRLDATDTIFVNDLDDFAGSSIAYLKAVYSTGATFDIEPTDSAMVYVYRRVNVRVVDGSSPDTYIPSNPGQPVEGATVGLTSTNVEAGIGELTYVGITDADGEVEFIVMSDRIIAGPTSVWVGGYDVDVTFGVHVNSTTIGLPAYYDGEGMTLGDTEHDVYIRLDNVLPDLDPPIAVSNDSPGRAETITINTTVTNIGDATAHNILVRFTDTFQGVPATMYETHIPSLAPGASQDVAFQHSWDLVSEISTVITGPHNVSVYIDPLDDILEQNETNNENYTLVNVIGQPDLTFVSPYDIDFSDPFPWIVVGDDFTISAYVTNNGDIEAQDVDVQIGYYGANDTMIVLGNDTIDVPAGSTIAAEVDIVGGFNTAGTYVIYAIIDPDDDIMEVDETNNDLNRSIVIYDPFDLIMEQVQFLVNGMSVTEVENGTVVTIRAMVRNIGQMYASNVVVTFSEGGLVIGETGAIPTISGNLSQNNLEFASYTWVATSTGRTQTHTISGQVFDNGGTALSSALSATLTVTDNRPDLAIVNVALAHNQTVIWENTEFELNVTVINNGADSDTAGPISVDVYDGTFTQANWIGNITIPTLAGGSQRNVLISCDAISGLGYHDLIVIVDPDTNTSDFIPGTPYLIYGEINEYDETNNDATLNITVVLPPLTFTWTLPSYGAQYEMNVDNTITVTGNVVRVDNLAVGVAGIDVTVTLGSESLTVPTGSGGRFSVTLNTPDSIGYYDIILSANGVSGNTTRNIEVIPEDRGIMEYLWIIILLIIIVVAIIVGITLYLYFVGLGKTVQCGECSAFIPEGAKKCPKCGVEFESDVAKCSVCGSWVPIDVKSCPDCGTEFTVGMEDLEDYESKMKKQYDDIVAKFRAEAKGDLGEKFTETEFQAWWAAQATFITFDQWLKEEEEMKRMGSKPCPRCGTENSVTAKICHKCGSLMIEEEEPPKKPPAQKPVEKKPVEPESAEAAPAAAAAAPVAAAPVAAAPKEAAPKEEKKQCPSCGMEVAVPEKTCPICNFDFDKGPEDKPPETPQAGAPQPVKKVVRKPVKKVVRRPVQKE